MCGSRAEAKESRKIKRSDDSGGAASRVEKANTALLDAKQARAAEQRAAGLFPCDAVEKGRNVLCLDVYSTEPGLTRHKAAGAHRFPSCGMREVMLELAAEHSTLLGYRSAAPDRASGDAPKSTPGDEAVPALSRIGQYCKAPRRDMVRKTEAHVAFLKEAFSRPGKSVTAQQAHDEMRGYREKGRRVFSAKPEHANGDVLSRASIAAYFSTLASKRKQGEAD